MVVRGGYGIYYNTSVYNIIAGNMAQQPPFAQALSVSSSAANPLNIQNGFLQAIQPSLHQHLRRRPELPHRLCADLEPDSCSTICRFGMFGTVGYLGTKGTRLDQQFIPNSVAPGSGRNRLCRITSSTKRRTEIRSTMRRSSS